MIKPVKYKTIDYDNVFIVSDLHINQTSGVVLEKRGFSSMQDHDNYIKEKWFTYMTQNSLVIDLGDSHFNCGDDELFTEFSKWPAKDHIYLWGNHISSAKQAYQLKLAELFISDGAELYPCRYNNIIFYGHYLELKIDHSSFVASHFPIAVHNNCAKGWKQLCGHSHNGFNGSLISNPDGMIGDFGVEAALEYTERERPFFKLKEALEIFSTKTHKSKDLHH